MQPFSLLYIIGPYHNRESLKESYQTLKDLGLDKIIRDIESRNHQLDQYFLEPLNQLNINYRLEVFKDLENESILNCIRRFEIELEDYFRRKKQLETIHVREQKYWYFLSLFIFYIDIIQKFYIELTSLKPTSRALTTLLTYVQNLTNKNNYYELKIQAQDILNHLKRINYQIKIKGDIVEVRQRADNRNYNNAIRSTFGKFTDNNPKDYAFRQFDTDFRMNNLEEEILKRVIRYNPDPFDDLSLFYNRHQNFFDPEIEKFYQEIQFYLTYLDYIEPLKARGLPFCVPVFIEEKDVNIIDGFELNLIRNQDKQEIILNDFKSNPDEMIFILTGANQGGKTTFGRMLGQIFYLASLGLPVPAREAQLYLVDRIFTHFEQEESIYTGNGKLKEDLVRAKKILDHATSNSLIILNEAFSSTTLEDALEISKEILKKINQIDCICLFITFLDSLTEMDLNITCLVATVDENDKRTFKILRKTSDGQAHALSIARKYHLTYEDLLKRIK